MRRVGRVNWLMLLGLIGIVGIFALLFMGGESPSSVGFKFMTALAKGDIDGLMEHGTMGDEKPEEVRTKWEYATKVVAPYYRFRWQILSETQSDPTNASVRLYVWRDAQTPQSYEENFGLPMVKIDGKWKVDVRALNRGMYPGLPR